MPKYYCDYCDAFLTHDSPRVRKTHNGMILRICIRHNSYLNLEGRRHTDNVRVYYENWLQKQAQKMIDDTVARFIKTR